MFQDSVYDIISRECGLDRSVVKLIRTYIYFKEKDSVIRSRFELSALQFELIKVLLEQLTTANHAGSTTDYNKVKKIANDLVDLLQVKGKHYGDAWKQDGGVIAYANILRKFRRLENQCKNADLDIFKALDNEKAEVLDTLYDIVGYALLIISEKL